MPLLLRAICEGVLVNQHGLKNLDKNASFSRALVAPVIEVLHRLDHLRGVPRPRAASRRVAAPQLHPAPR